MTLPRMVYLRRLGGEPVGPVNLCDLEALFDSRVVDERTPVSSDGHTFVAIEGWAEMIDHLEKVKAALDRGADAFTPIHDSEPAPTEPSREAPAPDGRTAVRMLLEAAVHQMSGRLTVATAAGEIIVLFREGDIAQVHTSSPDLELGTYLVQQGAITSKAWSTARPKLPGANGDAGAVLIEMGAIEPHAFLEKYVSWARSLLATAVSDRRAEVSFGIESVPNPPFPLGLDRLGVAIGAVRRGLGRATLADRLASAKGRLVIPAAVEGVRLEDCKLRPRELRALKAVNGVRTLQQILDELGGSEERSLAVLRAVFFAECAGFVSFGEDPLHRKELTEARSLERRLYEREKGSLFEVLSVSERSSDEEVRKRYAELAKEFHPDGLREEAAEELRETRRRYFALIGHAFESLDTESKRYAYAQRIEAGLENPVDEAQEVQSALHAETIFKKAQVLIRVRKFDEALQFLSEAISISPNDIEFQITEAYARHLLNTSRGAGIESAQQAVNTILKLLKKNGEIAAGHLYVGQLYTTLGKPELADKAFQRVLEYQPNHPEAERMVRLARMRRERKTTKRKKLFGL